MRRRCPLSRTGGPILAQYLGRSALSTWLDNGPPRQQFHEIDRLKRKEPKAKGRPLQCRESLFRPRARLARQMKAPRPAVSPTGRDLDHPTR
jgi:hypothetical protein